MTLNPAYKQPDGGQYNYPGYEDEVLPPGTTVVFYQTGEWVRSAVTITFSQYGLAAFVFSHSLPFLSPSVPPGSRLYNQSSSYKNTQPHSNALPPPPPLDGHSSSEDEEPPSQDEFSEQLSAAGFSPAPVKSKMAQNRPAKPSRVTPSTSTTRPRPPSMSGSPGKSTMAGTLTTISSSSSVGNTSGRRTGGQNRGFTVSQVQVCL